MNQTTKQVAIIGGGITGLSIAFYLQQHAPHLDVTLIESSSGLGGKIASTHEQGFVIEGGPDSFLAQKKSAVELCHTLGLDDQLIGSNPAKHPTYVWCDGKLHPMPEGMMLMAPTMVMPFLRSSLISWPGKIRMGLELFIPRSAPRQDESLAGFVRRRLGSELLDKIAAPLMAGIYAADPETLSLHSTFPMFPQMEQKYGGLIRSMIRQKLARKSPAAPPPQPAKPRSMFMTLRGGLQQLVDALFAQLKPASLLLDHRVSSVTPEGQQYKVAFDDQHTRYFDHVVLTTPAYVSSSLLQATDATLAAHLRNIRYVSTATVSLAFKRADIHHPLDGLGFVVPFSENRGITACTWTSQKFSDRAPSDSVLIRVFIGGALAEHLAEQDEATLIQLAQHELHVTMGIDAQPVLARAYRWHKSTPQYNVGHRERVAQIDSLLQRHPGLHLAGAAYHGAGIPDCIQSGVNVVQSILENIRTHQTASDSSLNASQPVCVH